MPFSFVPCISASKGSVWISCPSSFLFSLHNPNGFAPKKIYPNACNHEDFVLGGIRCCSFTGPMFGSRQRTDITTLRSERNPRFGSTSLGFGFGASLGNENLLVGGSEFLTTDMEIFGLSQ